MSNTDSEKTKREVRGWIKLASSYDRSKTTVQEWVEGGCPYSLDGKTHVFDLDLVDEWLDARSSMGIEEGGKEEFSREKLRKLKLEADKLADEKEQRQGNTATRAEMHAAYADGMKQIKAFVQKFVKEVKDSHRDMSATKAEKLDAEMIALFNRVADIRPKG